MLYGCCLLNKEINFWLTCERYFDSPEKKVGPFLLELIKVLIKCHY